MEIVLITGMSGSGKSVALNALEDAGPQFRIGDEFGVARGDGEVGLGQHHVHVGQKAPEERPGMDHPAGMKHRSGKGPVGRGAPHIQRVAPPLGIAAGGLGQAGQSAQHLGGGPQTCRHAFVPGIHLVLTLCGQVRPHRVGKHVKLGRGEGHIP